MKFSSAQGEGEMLTEGYSDTLSMPFSLEHSTQVNFEAIFSCTQVLSYI